MQETKLNGGSLDILSENVSKLKELFPEIVTEDKIDFEKLKEVLGDYTDENIERYNFIWNGKSAALRLAQTPSTGTLRPCKEESKNWDSTENLYIEGDNLEVLKLLQKSYYGKIKMIYIDPPYNTGKDFVYRDNYKDNLKNYLELTEQVDSEGNKTSTNSETHGRYHTNWLNMIYPRLRLARNLLTDDGVIFISIDDTEVENLKKVCNEIFGEENFIELFIWKSGRTSASIFVREHEYILAFAKNLKKVPLIKCKEKSFVSDRAIKKISQKNPASEIVFSPGIRFESEDKIFPKKFGSSEIIEVTKGVLEAKNGKLKNEVTIKAGWAMKSQIEKWLKGESVCDTKGQTVKEFFFKGNGVLQYVKEKGSYHPKTIIKDITTKQGTSEIIDLMKSNVMDYPKPKKLINFFLEMTNNTDLILDFFSGSATTAHAVMQLNSMDNGNRKFIMVQLPEFTDEKSEAYKAGYKNICEIGKERIRRAGDKIVSELKENDQTSFNSNKRTLNLDIGFKVFKLDSSNFYNWDPDYENLEQTLLDSVENLVPGRSELDFVYEVMLKYGIDLTLPVEEFTVQDKKVYSIGLGALLICLDDKITSNVATEIIKLKDELSPEIMRVVFKDNGFSSDSDKTNIKETLKINGIEDFVTL